MTKRTNGRLAPTQDPRGSRVSWSGRWAALAPPGAVSIPLPWLPAGRRRALRSVRSLSPGTAVAILDGLPGARRRGRRFARGAGVRIAREYLALPAVRMPMYVAEDAPASLDYLCRRLFVVPPSGPVLGFAIRVALGLTSCPFVRRRMGAVVPGRVTLGVRA